MAVLETVLSVVTDFLNQAQSLGIIKDFTLIQCEKIDDGEISKAEELLSEFLKKLSCIPVSSKNINSSITESVKVYEEDMIVDNNVVESSQKDLVQTQVDANKISKIEDHAKEKSVVQLQVDLNEMKRRISAFISRKRKELDESNVQEFCGQTFLDEQDPACEELNSCARVDAMFVPRRGCKSHIKVSKVRNVCGPQSETKQIKQEDGSTEMQLCDLLKPVDERLHIMESHLKLKTDHSLRTRVFQRLRNLEDRILLLESTSPEYIHLPNSDYSSPKKKSNFDKERIYMNCNTEELKNRIASLKQCLKEKPPEN